MFKVRGNGSKDNGDKDVQSYIESPVLQSFVKWFEQFNDCHDFLTPYRVQKWNHGKEMDKTRKKTACFKFTKKGILRITHPVLEVSTVF